MYSLIARKYYGLDFRNKSYDLDNNDKNVFKHR